MESTTIFYITIAVTVVLAIVAYMLMKRSSIESFVARYTKLQEKESKRYMDLQFGQGNH